METTNNNQKETTETSVLLSIPSCVAYSTLADLEDKDIKCKYLGVDQAGHILMKVSYFPWQKKFLKEIMADMKAGQVVTILVLALGAEIIMKTCQQYQSEIKEPIKEYFKYNGSN